MNKKSLFIGPYGENGALFREQVMTVLEDILQWRRGFHPTDERLILPSDKRDESWLASVDQLTAELDKLLGELKGSIPFHNPRFIGHMHADLAIPALLGYIAGQLYNQNNIVGESSPVTTQKEMAYIDYLCRMVGYPESGYGKYLGGTVSGGAKPSSGHLTTGGTTANIEAAWVASVVKYYPVTVKLMLAAEAAGMLQPIISALQQQLVVQIGEASMPFTEVPFSKLFDLSPKTVLELRDQIKKIIAETAAGAEDNKKLGAAFQAQLYQYEVRTLGIHGLHRAVNACDGTELPLPVILVPRSRHYSWEKSAQLLGLGAANVRYVALDRHFRIDTTQYKAVLGAEPSILMTVGVAGSTEEGAVDPIHEMLKANEESGKGFWFHIDAAYGGYYAAMVRPPAGEGKDAAWDQTLTALGVAGQFAAAIKAPYEAIHAADSVTIDPHKMGYIPYSVGALLFKDADARDFIRKDAPYLASGGEHSGDPAKAYLGGSMIEGSRSGAAALACYLTSRLISNDQEGYGQLCAETSANAISLVSRFDEYNQREKVTDVIPFKICSLYQPDTNMVCYVVAAPGFIKTAEQLNVLTNQLYEKMSASKDRRLGEYQFFVSKTEFSQAVYQDQLAAFYEQAGVAPAQVDDFDCVVLRSVLMNPLIADRRDELFDDYLHFLEKTAIRIFPAILMDIVEGQRQGKRHRVLWVENKKDLKKLKSIMESGAYAGGLDMAKHLEIDFAEQWDKAVIDTARAHQQLLTGAAGEPEPDALAYDTYIVDLNLADDQHMEMETGKVAVRDIVFAHREAVRKPQIIIYSQFLNPDFVYKGTEPLVSGLGEHIRDLFKIHQERGFEITYIGKTLDDKGTVKADLTELNDINALVTCIAAHAVKEV